MVAFNVFEPALRSRGNTSNKALEIYKDESFITKMESLLSGDPAGKLILPSLEYLFERLLELEKRVNKLENKLA